MTLNPQYCVISISELKLDPHNSRLPQSLHEKSEEDILEFMLLDASLIELMLAIGTNGFFLGEQLLVVKDIDDKFKVIEGNRRLSAVKLLNEPELAKVQKIKIDKVLEEVKYKPTEIPCLVFDSESYIRDHLGYKHITGIKEWKLLEKARYLNSVRFQNYSNVNINQASREIAKIVGGRTDYIKIILVGYEIFKKIEDEKYYRIKDLNDTTFHFNYIADSLNKSNINFFLGIDLNKEDPSENLNTENLKTWTKWFFEKYDQNRTRVIGTSGDLTKLNKILGNEVAKAAFIQKNFDLERAYNLTEDLESIFSDTIKKSIHHLEQADNIVHRLNNFYLELDEDLRTVRQLAIKIKNAKDIAEDEQV